MRRSHPCAAQVVYEDRLGERSRTVVVDVADVRKNFRVPLGVNFDALAIHNPTPTRSDARPASDAVANGS